VTVAPLRRRGRATRALALVGIVGLPATAPANDRHVVAASLQDDACGENVLLEKVVALVNEERARKDAERVKKGLSRLPRLRIDRALMRAAAGHNDLMIEKDELTHQVRGERTLGERIRASGYEWSAVAENVAAGQRTPAEVVTAWMRSERHRDNILSAEYADVGVAHGMTGGGEHYWTMVFAARLRS